MKPLWRRHRTWILTAALVVAPLGGVALILYGLARLAVRKRRNGRIDPYAEWLALRQQIRNRTMPVDTDGKPGRTVSLPRN